MINYEYEVDLEESCKQKFEDFISKIVANYCDDLVLHGWLGIKVVKDLPHNSSGRMEAGYILLPLATLNDILQGNTLKVQISESTIFHEFCHFDLLNLLPILHQEKKLLKIRMIMHWLCPYLSGLNFWHRRKVRFRTLSKYKRLFCFGE